jgi:hypothetical protein
MITKKIFLASSTELKEDRTEFELFIHRKNQTLVQKQIFLEIILWEDFLDAMSQTSLQDEYHNAIRSSDIFVMLFFTKVGQYTEAEFETAFGQFKATKKPLVYTYFKDADTRTGGLNKQDVNSLLDFKEKVKKLGHFLTVYKNFDDLKVKFDRQLNKLVENGLFAQQMADPVPEEKPSPRSEIARTRVPEQRSQVVKVYAEIESKQYFVNDADQEDMARFLARVYSVEAETIYVISSGYSSYDDDYNMRKRMKIVLDQLDACMKSGASIIRLQTKPDGFLAAEYINRVCDQINATTTMPGSCKVFDVRDQICLPSLAVVRLRDGTGSVWETLDRFNKESRTRYAAFVWRIHYEDLRPLADLIKVIDDIVRARKPLTAAKYRCRFSKDSETSD